MNNTNKQMKNESLVIVDASITGVTVTASTARTTDNVQNALADMYQAEYATAIKALVR